MASGYGSVVRSVDQSTTLDPGGSTMPTCHCQQDKKGPKQKRASLVLFDPVWNKGMQNT